MSTSTQASDTDRAERAANRQARDTAPTPGRALLALRHRETYTCAVCGTEFDAIKISAPLGVRYCSARCRDHARYLRRRERKAALAEAEATYQAVVEPAREAYWAATASAREACEAVIGPARMAYQAAIEQAKQRREEVSHAPVGSTPATESAGSSVP